MMEKTAQIPWDLWTAPQKLDKKIGKNLTWGVFIMKLTYEDRVQIHELRKQGQTFNQLSKRFGVDASRLRYMMRLVERYGIEIVKKGKNCYYSPKL